MEKRECILCQPSGNNCPGKIAQVTKGLNKIIECSTLKGDNVKEQLKGKTSITLHIKCRKDYTRRIEPPSRKSHHPSTAREKFDFKTQCIFCAKTVTTNVKKYRKTYQHEYSLVQTLEIVNTIRNNAEIRNDSWGSEVLLRLASVVDLVAAEGRYHRMCYKYFLRPKCAKPGTSVEQERKPNDEKSQAFMKLCEYLEQNDECQYSLDELMSIMANFDESSTTYSKKHLKRKLQEHFGNQVTISDISGKTGIACFTQHMKDLLSEEWYSQRESDPADEVKRLITTVAEIIRNDIRSRPYNCQFFPSPVQITSGNVDLVPESLRLLINGILKPKENDSHIQRKSVSLQHAVITSVRPRSFVSPIQIGLSVYLHRKFGSRELIDMLSNLGFCSPYREVLNYEASATVNSSTEVGSQSYIQFVYDNADYNVATLDGHKTFHSMGGIKCVTPAENVSAQTPIPRTAVIQASTLESHGLFTVLTYHRPEIQGYSLLKAVDIQNIIQKPRTIDTANRLDILWQCSSWLQGLLCPNWKGFMDRTYNNVLSYKTSAVLPLPFVNLNPNNPSTIYTCLLHAAEEGKKIGQSTTMVTFDQPLYAKACEMVLAAPPNNPISCLTIRLGGFHLLMSFLGAIGNIMAGSGLEELWQTVYAKNTVPHMMNGHAYSRSVRAHILTQQALGNLLLESLDIDEAQQNALRTFCSSMTENNSSVSEISDNSTIENIMNLFEKQLKKLESFGRTEKLWVEYFKLVGIIKLFIYAERIGDWNIHLYSVMLMIPYLHAAGHLNYAKYAHIYLQQMHELEKRMTQKEFEEFTTQGYFTLRRSDKFWSGIWTDMTIEQVLMRSIKTTGGLTRGRGITPSVIAKWVQAMPATTDMINAMESFSGVHAVHSEQHVELRESRQSRDFNDLITFKNWFSLHNPFDRTSQLLTSIASGIVAKDSVNCDEAFSIGSASMKSMFGKSFKDIHLQRKNNIKSLASVSKAIKVKDNQIIVNPNQLFHRIVCVAKSEDDLKSYLKYELAARPPSLFDDFSMRKGTKSSIVPLIERLVVPEKTLSDTDVYVLDGGYILHHVVWQCPATYSQICSQYISYIKQKFGNARIVFDGYEICNTKDEEHFRRGGTKTSRDVLVENHLQVPLSQQEFLRNSKNKTRFIKLLSTHLDKAGCKVFQAEGDADRLIVQTAIDEEDLGQKTVIVGEDSDLLILLIALANPQTEIKLLIPASKNRPNRTFSSSKIQSAMGEMTECLLFLYAVTGTDSTSALYRKGKQSAFKILQRNNTLQEKIKVFNDPETSTDIIAEAGEEFILALYGAKPGVSLDLHRYHLYLRTIAKQPLHARFDLATLPPTSAAARQHSFRVFHQVQQWLGRFLNPTEWGWKLEKGKLAPITSLQEPIPPSLFHIIACNCRAGCERNCECRRNRLSCTNMCGYCAGHGCSNQNIVDEDDLEELDDPTHEENETNHDEFEPPQKRARK